jgi:cell division protein FtsW
LNNLFKYLKGDKVIWVISLILMGFSIVSVYSFVPILVKIDGGSPLNYMLKHFLYVILGFLMMFFVHRKDPTIYSKWARAFITVSVLLMFYTIFFGAKVNDAGRWIRIPFVGLTFQSSDFAKIGLIIYLSRILVKKKDQFESWKQGFWPIMGPIAFVCLLILKDNFSTAAILGFIAFLMLIIARFPMKRMAVAIVGAITFLSLIVLLHIAAPKLNILPRYETWKNRIINKMDEKETDILANAQSNMASDAIFNGKFVGQGVGDGALKEYLPEAYADFYYASFVEEFGSLSAILLVLLYAILFYRILKIAISSDRMFETYICMGIGILLTFQAMINMMVCTGIMPVTGQNMPLLAMGGSAMIMTCFSLGIVQSIAFRISKETVVDQVDQVENSFA